VPLVRGRNTGGNFDILQPPEGEFHPASLARHEDAYRRYRENYAAQIEAHDREFGAGPAAAATALDPNVYLVGRGGYGAHVAAKPAE